MERETDQWQKQDLEEREQFTIAVLKSASSRALTSAEVLFLASELGVSGRDLVQHASKHREAA